MTDGGQTDEPVDLTNGVNRCELISAVQRCTGERAASTSVNITFQAQVASGAPAEIKTDATVGHLVADEAALDTDTANKEAFAAVKLRTLPPANHTSSTGGMVTPGGSPVAAGMLFVLAAGLATWQVWSRRHQVAASA